MGMVNSIFGRTKGPGKTPEPHDWNSKRSQEWNRWRSNQKLHPRGVLMDHQAAPPRDLKRDARLAKASTRAKRRRQHRAQSLADR